MCIFDLDLFEKNLNSLQCIFWWLIRPIWSAKSIELHKEHCFLTECWWDRIVLYVHSLENPGDHEAEQKVSLPFFLSGCITDHQKHHFAGWVWLVGTCCLGMQPSLPEWLKVVETYLETISWQKCFHTLPTTQVHAVKQQRTENLLMGSRRKMISSSLDWGPELTN